MLEVGPAPIIATFVSVIHILLKLNRKADYEAQTLIAAIFLSSFLSSLFISNYVIIEYRALICLELFSAAFSALLIFLVRFRSGSVGRFVLRELENKYSHFIMGLIGVGLILLLGPFLELEVPACHRVSCQFAIALLGGDVRFVKSFCVLLLINVLLLPAVFRLLDALLRRVH